MPVIPISMMEKLFSRTAEIITTKTQTAPGMVRTKKISAHFRYLRRKSPIANMLKNMRAMNTPLSPRVEFIFVSFLACAVLGRENQGKSCCYQDYSCQNKTEACRYTLQVPYVKRPNSSCCHSSEDNQRYCYKLHARLLLSWRMLSSVEDLPY